MGCREFGCRGEDSSLTVTAGEESPSSNDVWDEVSTLLD